MPGASAPSDFAIVGKYLSLLMCRINNLEGELGKILSLRRGGALLEAAAF